MIVFETLEDFRYNKLNEEVEMLNEGVKRDLLLFLKNPEKNDKKFKHAFANQLKRWSELSGLIDELDVETKKKIAQKGVEFIKANPSKDLIQLPLFRTPEGQVRIDINGEHGEMSGSGLGGRKGIHGGSSTNA